MGDNRKGQRIEGPTPNGGAYAIKYQEGNRIEIVEFDEDGQVIERTYGIVENAASA
jgi:hypothetical protein